MKTQTFSVEDIVNAVLSSQKGIAGKTLTLEQASKKFLAAKKGSWSASTLRSNLATISKLLLFFGPEIYVSQISKSDAQRFVLFCRSSTGNINLVALRNSRNLFYYVLDLGFIQFNPFSKLKLPRQQQKLPAYITQLELECILDLIKSQIIRDMIKIDFFTGLRLNELINLRKSDISMQSGKWVIVVGSSHFCTKTGRQRIVPVAECIIPLINSYYNAAKEKDSFLFAKNSGFPYSGDFLSKQFKRAVRDANMDDQLHFHSLRHSCASNLVSNGVSLYLVKEILGHSSVKTTEIYAHCSLDSLHQAINSLN